MRQLNCDELDMVSGGRAGYDSADDASFMSSYEVRAAEAISWMISDAWSEQQRMENAEKIYLAMQSLLETEAQRQAAPGQALTCQADPTFAAMINSPGFRELESRLIEAHKANGWEYGANFYGNNDFSGIFTSRLENGVAVNWWSFFGWVSGYADVFIHTHDGRVAVPGLSMSGRYNDIATSERFDVPVMAIQFNQDGSVDRYCYNPSPND